MWCTHDKKNYDSPSVAIGHTIKSLREESKLSVADLAKSTGLSESTIRRYEKGDSGMTFSSTVSIFEALGYQLHISLQERGDANGNE